MRLKKKLAQIKTAGFVLKPDAVEIKPIYEKIKRQFEAKGLHVLLAENSAKMIGLEGMAFDAMCEASDFLVSLGGDGTLLSLVRRSYGFHKPVVGINAGNLGFLADIPIEGVDTFLEQLFVGDYTIDNRMMIEGCLKTKAGIEQKFFALNDVVITRPVVSKMAKIHASIDGEWFNTYKGDGLIISTPTGSTAYSLSAGGPMMYPLTQAFILTPILAHSLSNQRPLVVPADFSIELSSSEEVVIAVIDGQDHYEMHEGDVLSIRGEAKGAELLHSKGRNYFAVLREKLSWGDAN